MAWPGLRLREARRVARFGKQLSLCAALPRARSFALYSSNESSYSFIERLARPRTGAYRRSPQWDWTSLPHRFPHSTGVVPSAPAAEGECGSRQIPIRVASVRPQPTNNRPQAKGIKMRTYDEFPGGSDTERMARVSAQYTAQRDRNAPTGAAFEALSRVAPEVPCKLAPSVRRRPAQQLPE